MMDQVLQRTATRGDGPGPRQLCELTQMLNLIMDRLLGRARRFVFALRLLRRAQIFDEREELVSPRAGAGP